MIMTEETKGNNNREPHKGDREESNRNNGIGNSGNGHGNNVSNVVGKLGWVFLLHTYGEHVLLRLK